MKGEGVRRPLRAEECNEGKKGGGEGYGGMEEKERIGRICQYYKGVQRKNRQQKPYTI